MRILYFESSPALNPEGIINRSGYDSTIFVKGFNPSGRYQTPANTAGWNDVSDHSKQR
jgi:hypothetical protein